MKPKRTYNANNLTIAEMQRRICRKFQVQANGCWLWTGYVAPKTQYGQYMYGKTAKALAHRYMYELVMGSIPPGLQLDHDCHNREKTCRVVKYCLHRRCVNPLHLIPVTPKTNTATGNHLRWRLEKTTCPQGHPYDTIHQNTHDKSRTFRGCTICQRERNKRRYLKV